MCDLNASYIILLLVYKKKKPLHSMVFESVNVFKLTVYKVLRICH